MDTERNFKNAWVEGAGVETSYLHWNRAQPINQVQFAFRQHWLLFSEIIGEAPPSGKRCVELGAGRGTISMYFADAGWDCTLVDISAEVLEVAREAFRKNGLTARAVVGDAMRPGLASGSFDVCVSIGLLEHLVDLRGALTRQVELLRPGGVLLAYVVPERDCRVQRGWGWLNDMLRGYHELINASAVPRPPKPSVYRNDAGIAEYRAILADLPVTDVRASGVYPLPMLSPSISFPFTLNPPEVELRLVAHFCEILAQRRTELGTNPWLCDEDYGQAFLVWARKT